MKYKEAAFHIAVDKENIEIIKILLTNENLDINLLCKIETAENSGNYKYDEKTALHIAIQKRNIEIIKLLLHNPKININIPFISYFKYSEGDFDSDDNHESKREKPTLILAVENQNIEIIQLLLSNANLDVNLPIKFKSTGDSHRPNLRYNSNIEEETPVLYAAVDEGNAEIVSFLLQNEKIDINLPFKHKMDIFSKKYHRMKVVAKENTSKYKEITPLHIAVKKRKKEIISLLLRNQKIDVNIPIKSSDVSESGKTALHLAVEIGNIEIIKILLQNKNINTEVSDSKLKIPVNYTENEEIKQLLKSAQ